MQTKILNYSFLGLLAGLLFFTSCTKEDNAIFGEKAEDSAITNLQNTDLNAGLGLEEELKFTTQSVKTEVVMRINGSTITTDAYAAYCSNGTDVFLAVSNKEILLDTLLYAEDFEENDFLFLHTNESEENFTLGGAAFGESVTGLPGLQIVFGEATVAIESADADVVIGSMSGTFQSFDPATGSPIDLPYSVTFSAEVVPNAVICW